MLLCTSTFFYFGREPLYASTEDAARTAEHTASLSTENGIAVFEYDTISLII